jgi:hypothetical protein
MRWFNRKWSRRRLALVVLPATFVFFTAFASSAFAGSFFVTGHDMDFHCLLDGPSVDECSYYKIATDFVRNGSALPVLILDRDNSGDGAPGDTGDASAKLEAVQSLNLAYSGATSTTPTSSSPPYVVEDPQALQPTIINGTPPPGITASSTWPTTPLVDGAGHPLWSAIIVASDTTCGGCDLNNTDGTHVDSDAINARTADIQSYFNAGGGLLYLAGANDAFQADGVTGKDVYYASLPVPVGGQPVSPPFTVSTDGAALGITDDMVNCCATHNSFSLPAAGSPIQVAETDSTGLAESLFLSGGTVCSSGFCKQTPTTTTTSLSGPGAAGPNITVGVGKAATDQATIAGTNAASASGTVTYTVYSDAACTKPVAPGTAQAITTPGKPPASAPTALSTPGTYYWLASYSGDGLNSPSASACGSEIETVVAPPAGTATLSGKTKPGKTLTCSASFTGSPTKITYAWYRNGTLLAGVTGPTHKLTKLDEGSTYYCIVTATNVAGKGSAKSNTLKIPVPKVPRCPAAKGKMTGTQIGQLKLGMTRSHARFVYRRHSNRGRKFQDFFCLTPIGVRAGYATPKLNKILSRSARARFHNRVVWASTSNPFYGIGGVHPGEALSTAAHVLHTGKRFHIGKNDWYLARKAHYTVVLKVRKGVVEETGIAVNSLTKGRKHQSVLMHSFF